LPSYLAAKQTAMRAVCKEFAGVTPDEALTGTLGQLDSMSKSLQDQQAEAAAKPGDIDALIANQEAALKQLGTLTGSGGKVGEVMKNIQTPGTPEAKRYEEVFNALPEVQAYLRQEQRLARAKQTVLDAEAKLPDHAASAVAKPADTPTTPPTSDVPAAPAK
jgi:hypothetical protein